MEKFSLIFLVFLIVNFVRIRDVNILSAKAKIVSKNISKFKKDDNTQGSLEYTVNLKDFEIHFLLLDVYKSFKDGKRDVWKE